jgi:hypothetical protein
MAKKETATAEVEIAAPAAEVWARIRDFDGMPGWHPGVEASTTEGEGEGAVRTLTMGDGSTVVERLDRFDDPGRSYRYSIVESRLPVTSYAATLRVEELGDDRCRVAMVGEMTPVEGVPGPELATAVAGFYRAGLEQLRRLFEAP